MVIQKYDIVKKLITNQNFNYIIDAVTVFSKISHTTFGYIFDYEGTVSGVMKTIHLANLAQF